MSAANVALPAIVTECCSAALLLLNARQQSIDISTAANSQEQHANDTTDGQPD